MNGLKPAEIESITLNDETGECEVLVAEDQLSLAIGKKGQNVRLAAKLTGWAINIVSASDARVPASSDEDEAGDGDSPTEAAAGTAVGELSDVPAIPGGASRTEIIATQVVDAAREQLPISTGETIIEGVPAITEDDESAAPPVAVENDQADETPKESPSA